MMQTSLVTRVLFSQKKVSCIDSWCFQSYSRCLNLTCPLMTYCCLHSPRLGRPEYLVFGEGMDQGAVDVVDGDAEGHDDDILGDSCS